MSFPKTPNYIFSIHAGTNSAMTGLPRHLQSASPPATPAPKLCLAPALKRKRRIDDAEAPFQKSLALNPKTYKVLNDLPDILIERGNAANAVDSLTQFHAMNLDAIALALLLHYA